MSESYSDIINKHSVSLLYYSTDSCNVCKSLYPKIEEMAKSIPEISLQRIDIKETPEISGQAGVFSIPAIVFYIEGKEVFRKVRYISVSELKNEIEKILDRFIR